MTVEVNYQKSWHVWVVKQNKAQEVEKFLSELSEVDDFFYPTYSKEYKLSSGKNIKKRVPVYTGYIFILYKHTDRVFRQLKSFPLLTTYVGECKKSDLDKVKTHWEQEQWNVRDRYFSLDDLVKVTAGPFKGFVGKVVSVNSNTINAMLGVFGREVRVSLSKDDADILKR